MVVATVIIGIVVALGCFAYFGPMRQARQMKIAREFLPVIISAVHSHPEFEYVTIGVGTGSDGCFLVVGFVMTEEQRTELKSIIAGTKPPVIVSYSLKVAETYSNVKP